MASDPNAYVYPNGRKAFSFLPDGSGFAYYPSGRAAVCVSTVSSYQNRFYFYDDSHKSSGGGGEVPVMVCCLDEFVVGFACDNSRGPNHGARMVFTKEGALIATASGVIERDWKWDTSAQNAGSPPPDPVKMTLTPSLTLIFTDRFTISARFTCEGATREFDLGMKLNRTTSYLDGASRIGYGKSAKLILQSDATASSLKERQEVFNEKMKMKRNKLNPRSVDLSAEMGTQAIVSSLEKDFDSWSKDHSSDPFLNSTWKAEANEQTMGEIPPIALTGLETGHFSGYGERMYMTRKDFDAAETLGSTSRIPPHLMDPKTKSWQNDLQIRLALVRENPLLPRTKVLNDASGTYSENLVVPGGVRKAMNPTGKAETLRRTLQTVKASELEGFVTGVAGPSQVVTVVCVRQDDYKCRKAQTVAEVVNGMLHEGLVGPGGPEPGAYNPETAEHRIVKVDMAESRHMAEKYQIKCVPFVLIFYGGQVVYGGTMGGEAVRVAKTTRCWKVLLVEPNFADQLKTETVLRKRRQHNTWDLAMTAPEAILHKQRLAESGHFGVSDYDLCLVSDAVPEQDISMLERAFKSGSGGKAGQGTLVVGMRTVKGDEGHRAIAAVSSWEQNGLYTKDTSFLNDRMASACELAITKPVGTRTMQALDELLEQRRADAEAVPVAGRAQAGHDYIGMTPKAIVAAMVNAAEDAKRGKFVTGAGAGAIGKSGMGFTLSSQETPLIQDFSKVSV